MKEGFRSSWVVAFLVAALWCAAPAFALGEELDEARKLVAEAKALMAAATDPSVAKEQRAGPRAEAAQKLTKAKEIYDRSFNDNPKLEKKFFTEYCDALALLKQVKPDPAGDAAKGGSLPPGMTGFGGPAHAGATLAERAKRQYDVIVDYQKKNPMDIPALQQLCARFVAEITDPTLPEYGKVVEMLSRMNDKARAAAAAAAAAAPPPAAPADVGDPKETIPGRLTQDIASKDPDVRKRAAIDLGKTRSGGATWALARGIKDEDADVARACRDSLVAIGGSRAGENLVRLYRDASRDDQRAALGILRDIARKGASDAEAVSPHIGRFVLTNDEQVAQESIGLLTEMGAAGGPGLLVAIDSQIRDKKRDVMDAMGAIKFYAAATRMGEYLVQGDGPQYEPLRNTAIKNLKAMGIPTVPYLIPLLQTKSRQWTSWLLREITGVKNLGFNDSKEWRDWYEENKPPESAATAPAWTPPAAATTPAAPVVTPSAAADPVETRETPIPGRLTQDMASKDPETRKRAAAELGKIGSGGAAWSLTRGIKDEDPSVAKACRDALVTIGGSRAGENLVRIYRDASRDDQRAALGVLRDIGKKGGGDADAISPFIGRFVLTNDDQVAQEAIAVLVGMGKAGGPGLLVGIDSQIRDKKMEVMDALGTIRYCAAATRMGEFLVQGDGPQYDPLRNSAIKNLKAMGIHTLPYLIPLLQTKSRQWTSWLLREITGVKTLGFNDAQAWREWYEENKSSAAASGDGAPGK